LVSIGHHMGGSSSGHYVAMCRHPTDEWYIIDDENVRKANNINEVQQGCDYGYLYFYRAKENRTLEALLNDKSNSL
jgi:ubiquitin C-terminal hydrolase